MRRSQNPYDDFYHRKKLGYILMQGGETGLFAGFFLFIAFGTAWYGLFFLVDAAKEIIVASITGAASLLTIIFGYMFQRERELELAAFQRWKELESAEHQVKEKNYSRIIERLAKYIRNSTENLDEFTTAHLYLCVIGSSEVVTASSNFIETKNFKDLDDLLKAMRKDLSMENSGDATNLTTKNLFPVQTTGGLSS